MNDPYYHHRRLPVKHTLGAGHFVALYSAEHVAGGEFVIGIAFAQWGVSPQEILYGLLLGNILAVLSWAWACAPIATSARLTLYRYLARLAGDRLTMLYNILNGVIFAVIAGGMLTISASAINALFKGVPQVQWYPTSGVFILAALALGVLMTTLALRGFVGLANISRLCAPWLGAVFLVSGIASLPFLWQFANTKGVDGIFGAFAWAGGNSQSSLNKWHIAAFAWGLNLPLHLGMGDMSTLRFARHAKYGYLSAFAAFGGHFVAWMACAILGATTALLLQADITSLDVGSMVLPILGVSGIVAVVVASMTTAVPSFYRACLAFELIGNNQFAKNQHNYRRVVIALGVLVSCLSCLPLIFLKWLDIMVYFNILLAPIGAIILAEHFILPCFGIRPLWRELRTDKRNYAAAVVWCMGIVGALWLINVAHLFFVFIGVYALCVVLYSVLGTYQAWQTRTGLSVDDLHANAYGSDEKVVQDMYAASPSKSVPIYPFIMLVLMVLVSAGGFFIKPHQYLPIMQALLIALSVLYFGFVYIAHKKQAPPKSA